MKWEKSTDKLKESRIFEAHAEEIAELPTLKIKTPIYTVECPDEEGNYYCSHIGSQGGCFDGRYHYQAFLKYCYNQNEQYEKCHHVNDKKNIVRIMRYDIAKKEISSLSQELDCLNHINDMTLHPMRGQIIACNSKGNKRMISFLNTKTLEYEGNRLLEYELYAIDYHVNSDRYVLGISGTDRIVVTDNEFSLQREICIDRKLREDYTKQNICCDDVYIYCLYSGKKHAVDRGRVLVYNWSGELITVIRLVDFCTEPENISVYESALFVSDGKKLYAIIDLKKN